MYRVSITREIHPENKSFAVIAWKFLLEVTPSLSTYSTLSNGTLSMNLIQWVYEQ